MLCIDQLDASTRDNLLRTSLAMWKENLIRSKHERDNITTPCATDWEAESTYSFDTSSTDLLSIIRVKSLSPYHVFCSQVSEYRQVSPVHSIVSTLSTVISGIVKPQRWIQHLWYRQVSYQCFWSASIRQLLRFFFVSASDKFFVSVSAFNQQASGNFFVSASDNFFVSASDQCVSDKLFVSASDNSFVSAFDQCVSDKLFVSASDKFSRVSNHQTSPLESAIIRQVLSSQQFDRQIQSQQHRSTSQQVNFIRLKHERDSSRPGVTSWETKRWNERDVCPADKDEISGW